MSEVNALTEQQVEASIKIGQIYHIAERILSNLDAETLGNASRVSPYWRGIIRDKCLWKKLLEKNIANDPVWAKFVKLRRRSSSEEQGDDSDDIEAEVLCGRVSADIKHLESRWQSGRCPKRLTFPRSRFHCDADTAVFVSMLGTIVIWNLDKGLCVQSYTTSSHDSPTCIRFNDRMIICAYSNGFIRIWDRNDPDGSGACQSFRLGTDSRQIESLELSNNIMVIRYSTGHLAVSEIHSPRDVTLRRVIRASPQIRHIPIGEYVEFANKYVVNIGTEIMFLDSKTYTFVKTLGACKFRYKNGLVATIHPKDVANNQKVELWNVESGTRRWTYELKTPGNACISFDERHLVVVYCVDIGCPLTVPSRPGKWRGIWHKILIWDIKSLLDKGTQGEASACITMKVRFPFVVENLAIDAFRIKCWSKFQTAAILDFRIEGHAADRETSFEEEYFIEEMVKTLQEWADSLHHLRF